MRKASQSNSPKYELNPKFSELLQNHHSGSVLSKPDAPVQAPVGRQPQGNSSEMETSQIRFRNPDEVIGKQERKPKPRSRKSRKEDTCIQEPFNLNLRKESSQNHLPDIALSRPDAIFKHWLIASRQFLRDGNNSGIRSYKQNEVTEEQEAEVEARSRKTHEKHSCIWALIGSQRSLAYRKNHNRTSYLAAYSADPTHVFKRRLIVSR